MGNLAVLFIHFIAALARLLGPDGVRSLVAPDPDLESLSETISPSTRIGPDPRWLAGTLGAPH